MKVRTGIKAGNGLGDTVSDLTRITGVDQLAKAYEQLTGKPCGCEARKEKLNQLNIPLIT
ncbi:MAG TPA: hypothetical protein VI776_09590 [Anaerolineales bacterium]|nr:hypothetical protein [Anaerolineales bacterium]